MHFVWIKDDHAYLIPIGDIHIGDRAFAKKSLKKLKGYIEWVEERDNARILLMGDIFNVATRNSATTPFQTMSLKEEMEFALELFEPVKSKIIGAIDGNHEYRAIDYMDYSPLIPFCHALGIKYFEYSAAILFGVGRKNKGHKGKKLIRPNILYTIYAHHTTGGGSTIGGRINRVDKLRQIVVNADIYLGAHNHALITAPADVYVFDPLHKKVVRQRQYLVDCGSYLEWNGSYAEKRMYPPLKIGSPRIRLDGVRKDVHVSI